MSDRNGPRRPDRDRRSSSRPSGSGGGRPAGGKGGGKGAAKGRGPGASRGGPARSGGSGSGSDRGGAAKKPRGGDSRGHGGDSRGRSGERSGRGDRPDGRPARRARGDDRARGDGRKSGAGDGRTGDRRGRSGAKRGGRIPPPPDRTAGDRASSRAQEREEVRIERVVEPKKRKKSGRRRGVDVSHVDFPGVGAATAAKLTDRLAEAATAFEAERFGDALKLLDSIDKLAPGVAEVHELAGLSHYRLGRWVKATAELERFGELTNSVEQHPVLADCARALKRWARAEELWHELGEASPSAELIEEGRIVQAGALADRGRLDDAIRFMERAPSVRGKPAVHHLRRWYALADLYERAGDHSRARRLFSDIVRTEPDFGDAAERAAAL